MEQHNFGAQYPGRFLPSVQDPRKAELLKLKKTAEKKIAIKKQQQRTSKIQQTGFELGRQIAGFARPPQEDFSFQEQVLRETVGGRGDKIWGTVQEPVHINHDLNPRQSGRPDTDETAEIFGFNKPKAFGGGDRETAGMFGL